jgi:hypothetical protein
MSVNRIGLLLPLIEDAAMDRRQTALAAIVGYSTCANARLGGSQRRMPSFKK